MNLSEIRTDRIFIDLKILIVIISNLTINRENIQNLLIGGLLFTIIFSKIVFKNFKRQQRIMALFYQSSQILIASLFASLQFQGQHLQIQFYTLGLITQSSFNLCKDLDLNSGTELTKFRSKFITCILQIIAVYSITIYLMKDLVCIEEILFFSLVNFLNILECLYDYKEAMLKMNLQNALKVDESLQQQQNNVIKDNELMVIIEKSLNSNRINNLKFALEEEQSKLINSQIQFEFDQKKSQSSISIKHSQMEYRRPSNYNNNHNPNAASTIFNPSQNINVKDNKGRRASRDQNKNVIHKDLFEVFPEGVIIMNSRMRYVFMNSSLQKHFNQTNKQDTFDEFMGLRNSRRSVSKQGKQNSLQVLLDKRIQKSQSLFSNSNEDIEVEQIDFQDNSQSLQFDENLTVEEILQTLMTLTSIKVPIDDNLYQVFDLVEIICEYSGSVSSQLNQIPPSSSINNPSISMDQDASVSPKTQKFLFQLRFLPYFSKGKLYILCQVHDITMFNVVKVLKAMNQTKQKMLSFVAHEFRTPLNCIILMLMATLDKDSASGEQIDLKLIETSLVQAESLLILVNDLLDISQIQATKFKINMIDFDFFELLSDVHNLLNLQAQNLEIDLQLNIQENIPRFIMSDPNRIRQVIINLAGNAIKFTPKGKIMILIQSVVLKEIIITIVDNGKGINLENQGKLFKAFAKLDDPMNQNLQGVGLGLVISNILAQKLSVSVKNPDSSPVGIQVFSQGEGHGSQFQFTIFNQSEESSPDKSEHISRTLVRNAKREKESLMKKENINCFVNTHECQCPQILIVDDNQFNINAQKILLKKEKLIIDEAFCGSDAIKKVQGYPKCLNECNNYTIILLDLEMPDMNGFQTSQQLIQYCDENQIHCYIIGFSGHSSEKEKKACLMAGMIDLIEKPAKSKLIMDYFQSIKQQISKRKYDKPSQQGLPSFKQEKDMKKSLQIPTQLVLKV